METLRENTKEMLGTKNIVTEMKHASDGLISGFNTQPGKVSWISQQKFPNWKAKRKENEKIRKNKLSILI